MLFKSPKSLLDSISNIIKDDREKYIQEQQERDKLVAEKMLSPKQKKIAAVAGHPGKIDAADFHALRAGKQMKENSDMSDKEEKSEKPFKYNKKTGTFDKVKKMEEETKKDFKARQERLAAASAQTAKDPVRLARLSKIPGYTAAMDLAKKTTQKEETDTPGNGREHQCAIHVKSEQFGEGKTLTTQHAEPDMDGNIEWYDVMFDHGIERVMTEDIEILVSEAHTHSKKKGM